MKILTYDCEFTQDALGTMSSDPELHATYIASKAPDAPSRKEEVEALGVEEVDRNGMTVFPKDDDGTPFIWDYQIKGFYKDACKALKKVTGSKSSKLKNYKGTIDGAIFIKPRRIRIDTEGRPLGRNDRPLRADTAQGPRVAIASSETVPAGSTFSMEIQIWDESVEPMVKEWMQYGRFKGLLQWRNGGWGTFVSTLTGETEMDVAKYLAKAE